MKSLPWVVDLGLSRELPPQSLDCYLKYNCESVSHVSNHLIQLKKIEHYVNELLKQTANWLGPANKEYIH